jgi:hypothetical protein
MCSLEVYLIKHNKIHIKYITIHYTDTGVIWYLEPLKILSLDQYTMEFKIPHDTGNNENEKCSKTTISYINCCINVPKSPNLSQ